jgi:hypothetical protein
MLFGALTKVDHDAPVRFWAQRSTFVYWRSFFIVAMLLGPLAFLAPNVFITCTLAGAAVAWANARSFRFRVTDRQLQIRPSALSPTLAIALDQIRAAHVEQVEDSEDDDEPVIGTVVLHLTNDRRLPISGIVEPVEAANAIRVLKSQLVLPATAAAEPAPWGPRQA